MFMFIVSASGDQNHNIGQILTLGGHFVKGGRYRSRLSPLPVRAKFGVLEQTHGMHSRVKFRLDWFIRSSSGGKNPQFLPFFGLRNSVVSPVGGILRKLNMGAQLQAFPYPTASKLFLYSNAFMAKSGAQTLKFKSVTDKSATDKSVTDRQKTQRFWSPRRRVKSERHQTWHGDRGPRALSCVSKTLRSDA